MVMRAVSDVPAAVQWAHGMVLEPAHFERTDRRSARLAHLAGLLADPWPWGFTALSLDEVALANGEVAVECQGLFPDGHPVRSGWMRARLPAGHDGDACAWSVRRDLETGAVGLDPGECAPGEAVLPVARLVFRGGAWRPAPQWSPPALVVGPEHPIRADLNRQLGVLAALGAGFVATLRLPGAEHRPVSRVLGQVAVAIAQGVGVIEALLAAPAVTPGRIGVEALRLALGVRCAAGQFEAIDEAWAPADQRGSLRRLLQAAEQAASGIGLPFRAAVFRPDAASETLVVDAVPGGLLLAIEAARPEGLIAARHWLDGAAVAAPERIEEALKRRVSGCRRRAVDRDPTIGVSSGPLLALYHVDDDAAWRGGHARLALAAKTPPPPHTSFSVLIVESPGEAPEARPVWAPSAPAFGGLP